MDSGVLNMKAPLYIMASLTIYCIPYTQNSGTHWLLTLDVNTNLQIMFNWIEDYYMSYVY